MNPSPFLDLRFIQKLAPVVAANSIAVVCLCTNPEVVVMWSVFASQAVVVHLNERSKNTDP